MIRFRRWGGMVLSLEGLGEVVVFVLFSRGGGEGGLAVGAEVAGYRGLVL